MFSPFPESIISAVRLGLFKMESPVSSILGTLGGPALSWITCFGGNQPPFCEDTQQPCGEIDLVRSQGLLCLDLYPWMAKAVQRKKVS